MKGREITSVKGEKRERGKETALTVADMLATIRWAICRFRLVCSRLSNGSPVPAEKIREPSECRAAGKKRASHGFLARTKDFFCSGSRLQHVDDAPLTEEPETEEANSTE